MCKSRKQFVDTTHPNLRNINSDKRGGRYLERLLSRRGGGRKKGLCFTMYVKRKNKPDTGKDDDNKSELKEISPELLIWKLMFMSL
jgi:hypothetical protein